MPYPELMVTPMRQDLTVAGFSELTTGQAVSESFNDQQGVTLLVINSVCGCAAGAARPAVKIALERTEHKPDHLLTVFAGQDVEATDSARALFPMLPPSSPSFIITKNGEATHYIPRHRIEMRTPEDIAEDIVSALKELAA